MAAFKGKFALDKGDLLGLEDILGAAEKQGVVIEKRDILCLRIGFLQLPPPSSRASSSTRTSQRTRPDVQSRAGGLVQQDGNSGPMHRYHQQRM